MQVMYLHEYSRILISGQLNGIMESDKMTRVQSTKKIITKLKTILLLTSSSCVASHMLPAVAQDGNDRLDTIVVTAEKREENLQTVPVAVTAFSGDDIRELGFTNSVDIAAQVPGLNIGTPVGEGNNPSITLRGVGLNDFNDNNEGSVSVYNDGVYVAALPAQTFQLFDLERVEVLRGPQGTLFGRNATGGLIQFAAAKPMDELDAFASITFGSVGQIKSELALGGALVDGVRGRLSFTSNNHDGYVTNTLGSDGNESNSFALRGQLDFDIGERGSLLLRGDYGANDVGAGRISPEATGSPFNEVFGLPLVDTFGFADLDGDPFTVTQDRTGNVLDVDTFTFSGTFDYELNDWLTFTSITAYSETDRIYQEDTDAGPFPGLFADFESASDQFTQEIRFAGDHGAFRWQAGGFYFDSTVQAGLDAFVNQPIEFVDFLDDLSGADGGFEGGISFFLNGGQPLIDGGLFEFGGAQFIDPSRNPIAVDPSLATVPISGTFLPFIQFDANYTQETESFAGFFQFDYDLTETITFTGGIRYTDDSRDIQYLNAAPAGPVLNDFFAIPGLADENFPDLSLFEAFGSTAGNFFDFTDAGLAANGNDVDLNNISDNAVTGRAVLEYQPTDDVLLYASYNRGFKSAGFNTGFLDSSDGVTVNDVAYDSEVLNSYEVGLKSTFGDGRFRFNATGFYYDYNDFQALTFQGLSQFITNADATFFGGEIEAAALLFDGLEARFALSYLDTDVDGVQDLNSGTTLNDLEAVLAPNLTFNGSLSYERDLAVGSLKGAVDFSYQGEQFFDITNSDVSQEDSYALVNLRLAYTTGPSDNYEVAFFVNNLTDTEYRVYTFDFTGPAGFNQQFFGRPRWFGGSFTYRY